MNQVMNDVKNALYKKFKFIEPNIYEFEKIIFKDVEVKEYSKSSYTFLMEEGKNNLSDYIVETIRDSKFAELFNKSSKVLGLKETFSYYGKFIDEYSKTLDDFSISGEDMEELIQNSEYQSYYENLIKIHEHAISNDDFTFVSGSLLRDIIETVSINADFEKENLSSDAHLSNDHLKDYIKEITKFAVLTHDEEMESFKKLEEGDLDVKDFIVEHNLKLAFSIAKRKFRKTKSLSEMDLIQFANIGLLKAVERFDYKKGYKFSTYATWWIKQSVQRGICDTDDTVRVPVHANDKYNEFIKNKSILEDRLQREATDKELIAFLGISNAKLSEYKSIEKMKTPTSIDKGVGDDEESTLGDFLTDEDAKGTDYDANLRNIRDMDDALLECLDERQRDIIKKRFGYDDNITHILEDIGEEYGITRERIRQIEAKAIRKMKVRAKQLFPDEDFFDEAGLRPIDESKKEIMKMVGLSDENMFDKIMNFLTESDRYIIEKRAKNKELSLEESIHFSRVIDMFRNAVYSFEPQTNSVTIYGRSRRLPRNTTITII